MEAVTRGSVYLPNLYRKIESLPSMMQDEVLLFTDFLHNKSRAKADVAKANGLDANSDDNHFSNLSLLSLSKEWNSSEDEEWDAILSEMPSIQ